MCRHLDTRHADVEAVAAPVKKPGGEAAPDLVLLSVVKGEVDGVLRETRVGWCRRAKKKYLKK